jgi:cardiolipin synthase
MVADAVGSAGLSKGEIQRLVDAGGHFKWYMPLRWYTWPRVNNRTHRELLIIDGRVGFVGGSGWADHWMYPEAKDKGRWRDTMFRVEGPAVTGLQATFSENWLEASGKVLTGTEYFPFPTRMGGSTALIVTSSPTSGRSTPARVLFQVLVAAARERIDISTPYFLPDKSLSDELVRASKRGVKVRILTPGALTDHALTRRSSRRLMGPLLTGGARIWEYQGAMLHAKIMTIDDQWALVGTTNMDSRSFRLNDEVNLATPDSRVVRQLQADFENDLRRGKEVSYEEWRHRGIAERLHELFGSLFQRQE